MKAPRRFLLPLVPLYWIGLRVKNGLFERGVQQLRSLGKPVISIGSLSAGGAGKTPVVLMLAELLHRHGISVDVLSRGYGRRSNAVEQVDAEGTAERYGDEPIEMTRAGEQVFVGADRFAAGALAESRSGVDVHLLDDGFQHRRLRRDLEVVLLTRTDKKDSLLPAGDLREPMRSLERADVVVLREEEAPELQASVAAWTNAEVWIAKRELTLPGRQIRRPFVFCGIARPDDFLTMLRTVGCTPAGTMMLPDHHRYTHADITRLVASARSAGADGFCTTAKDEVKITEKMRQQLESVGGVMVPRLRVSLLDEERAMRRLLQVIRRTGRDVKK